MIKLLSGYRWDRGHGIISTNSLPVGWTDCLLLLYWYLLLIASLSLLTLFILHPHFLSFSPTFPIYLLFNFSFYLSPNNTIKYLSSLLLSTPFYLILILLTSLYLYLLLCTRLYFFLLLSPPLYVFLLHFDDTTGACDGMTYEEISQTYPEEFVRRETDKLAYRYPR